MQTQIGFKVSITIECETEQEILSHLSEIRKRLKRELRPNNGFNGHIPDGVDLQWEDNNCYGTHEVKIEPDIQ